jgi:4-carboxymuconolactone decarboxylase
LCGRGCFGLNAPPASGFRREPQQAEKTIKQEKEAEMSAKSPLFEKGLKARREVLGADYVDTSIANANEFTQAFQEITTEWCWGYAWTRPGLDRKTRSMLNLAMLTALNRAPELKLHVRGAITNGVTVEEIREILVHATIYCGVPAGLDAFKAANEVLKEMGLIKQPAKKEG